MKYLILSWYTVGGHQPSIYFQLICLRIRMINQLLLLISPSASNHLKLKYSLEQICFIELEVCFFVLF